MIIVLKKYLGEWLGGPKLYSTERGHPMLRARHLPFAIGVAERDAWLLCMNGALDETIADEAARAGHPRFHDATGRLDAQQVR